MLTIPNITIKAQIYESANSLVYRAKRNADNQDLILKVLKENYPTPQELARYRTEYKMIQSLNIPGVVHAYDLQPYQDTLIMFLEDFGGESLRVLMEKHQFPLAEFLRIAIKTTEILGQIHAANIIHKDINPANIVFCPQTGELKIIDFGISTQLTRENPTWKNPNILEGTLAYISPEQTGRMNRSLDYRTDFYSLGATFYEMLTEQVPFTTNDPLELVHCHIAKQPLSPSEINPNIPPILTQIILKMMAKTAEDRYQSAHGIKSDLEECLKQLENPGIITGFPLARYDISDKFQLPQKLYGREKAIKTLLAAFDRVMNDQKAKIEMMLVAGYSGIGKSSLVAETHKSNTRMRGYFTAGKFDQFQRSIPYSAIVNAFQGLVRQLLTESEAQLEQWRAKLLGAFGLNGQVIIDVIPEVALIVGEQPPVPELGAVESQNRFNIVFSNFMRSFCTKEHPLVIFLDDLQWADSATLKLIELIMTDTELQYLFLIGAYRDNEVSPTHPLMMTVDGLIKEGAIINFITLEPLKLENISQLIADTLSSDTNTVKSLAELVTKKTGGNPFFINQFLQTLENESLIKFDFENYNWQWNIAEIEAQNITDNVVELMIKKMKKLPEITQEFLRLASCIGASFYLNTLSIICEKTAEIIFPDLVAAIQTGLILPKSDLDQHLLIQEYKFLHDRVQQAAYSLIDDDVKKLVHLKIGRLLLENLPKNEQDARIFEIVDHLNLGQNLITNEIQKIGLARLNLEAGKKAKEATAYVASLAYLRNGLACLNTDCWHQHYELSLNLHKELAEVEYLNGNFEESEAFINLILQEVHSNLEKAEIYILLLIQYTMSAKYKEAIAIGQKALALLDIDLPDTNLQEALEIEISHAKENLGTRKIAALIDEPEIIDPQKRLALKLLTHTDPPAYFGRQEMYPVIVAKMANISLQYGNIAESAKGFVTYGIILGSVLGDYQSGYEFGKLSVQISDKFNNSSQKCSSCLVLAGHLNHWVRHIKWAEAIFNQSYQAGLECGELRHSGYALEHQLRYLFYQGKNIGELVSDVAKFLHFSQKTKNQWATDGMLGFQITLFNLSGRTPDKLVFCNEIMGDEEYLQNCHLHNSFAWICTYNIFKSQVLYLYDRPEEALVCAREAKKFISFTLGHFQSSEQNFHASLILAALYSTVSESEQKQYRDELELQQKQMKIWADNCPENFLHKYLLVEAEIARISGQQMTALDLYEQAITSARENDYIQNEALGNELAAKLWLSKGNIEIAELYMKKAHYRYQLWGAKRKVEDLEQKYPHLLSKKSTNKQTDFQTKVTRTATLTTGGDSDLDFSTAIKASQALAGEIALDKLLAKLMQFLLENSGAQKGFLILSKQGKLTIEAIGEVDQSHIQVSQSIPVESSELLPVGMLQYVARTLEDVVLSEATKEGVFTTEPYILNNQPKSVLCAPIINQGKLIGILYLENNLTMGAFTPNRLALLKVLSAQAAISIENAELYQNLENKVQERTLELAQANQEIIGLNERLKAENLRMSAELDITKQLQQMVLPKPAELASITDLDIAGFMEPADEVGGDYYDVLVGDGQVTIGIGDVTGHGLESGLLMLMTQTAATTLQASQETDPIAFLTVVNRALYRNTQRINSEKTLSLAFLNYQDGLLTITGQHEQVIIVRNNGEVESIDTDNLGFPICLEAEINDFIATEQVSLNIGDVVVLYTDGITEAENLEKQQYGLEKLIEVVKENWEKSASEIQAAVISNLREFIGKQKVFDDITLVVLKRK